jgi:hypothetical protein
MVSVRWYWCYGEAYEGCITGSTGGSTQSTSTKSFVELSFCSLTENSFRCENSQHLSNMGPAPLSGHRTTKSYEVARFATTRSRRQMHQRSCDQGPHKTHNANLGNGIKPKLV